MLTVQIFYHIREEFIQTFKTAILINAQASQLEVGVIRFDVFQDQENPTQFSLIEIYRDREAQKSHFETNHFEGWRVLLAETEMVIERSVRTWDNLYPESGMFGYPLFPQSRMNSAPLGGDAAISLREVTEDNLRAVLNLHVDAFQQKFVANNARSIAQASLEPKAWLRAIYADETPVGFIMNLEDPGEPQYYLWRFMIDYHYQGLGFGKRALEIAITRVRGLPNATEYVLSYVPAPGCPRDFYAKLGFEDTGEEDEGELLMKLKL